MSRRNLRALLFLPILPLSLAACGGTSSGGATVADTAATTTSAGNDAKTVYELCSAAGELDRAAFLEAAKNSRPKEKTAHVEGTMDMTGSGSATGAAGQVEMTGDFDATDSANPKVAMSMDMGGTAMEIIMIDKTAYMKMGQMTGGKYAKISPSDIAAQGGFDFTGTTDPAAQLEKSKDAIVKISCVGREDVGGTKTAHLQLTVDPRKALEAIKPTSGTGNASPGTKAVSPGSSPSLPATVTSDQWVDESGRTWKVRSDMGKGSMTMTYSKWGEPVTIAAPATDQVTQMPKLGGAGSTPKKS